MVIEAILEKIHTLFCPPGSTSKADRNTDRDRNGWLCQNYSWFAVSFETLTSQHLGCLFWGSQSQGVKSTNYHWNGVGCFQRSATEQQVLIHLLHYEIVVRILRTAWNSWFNIPLAAASVLIFPTDTSAHWWNECVNCVCVSVCKFCVYYLGYINLWLSQLF